MAQSLKKAVCVKFLRFGKSMIDYVDAVWLIYFFEALIGLLISLFTAKVRIYQNINLINTKIRTECKIKINF